jgi:hypothetical protein
MTNQVVKQVERIRINFRLSVRESLSFTKSMTAHPNLSITEYCKHRLFDYRKKRNSSLPVVNLDLILMSEMLNLIGSIQDDKRNGRDITLDLNELERKLKERVG